MSNARKKVLIRRFSGDILPGYLPPSGFVRGDAPAQLIDLLDLSGRILEIALKDIKTISFVRDFNLSDTTNPERLTRRTFLARPRNEGLWVRLTFVSVESRRRDASKQYRTSSKAWPTPDSPSSTPLSTIPG